MEVIYGRSLKENGIVRFGADVIADANGEISYQLCARRKRHYTVKYRIGGQKRILSNFASCDGKCKNGVLVKDASPELLFRLGICKKVAPDQVLIASKELRGKKSYVCFEAGTVISEDQAKEGMILRLGESMVLQRTLDNPILLSPPDTPRRDQVVVSEITDTISNNNGKAVIKNNEAELRARQEEFVRQYREAADKAEAEQQAARTDFARGVSAYLRGEECRFTKAQADELFRIAGPGQCRKAVQIARWAQGSNRNVLFYDADRYDSLRSQHLARKGAHYILDIGGVPADRHLY